MGSHLAAQLTRWNTDPLDGGAEVLALTIAANALRVAGIIDERL